MAREIIINNSRLFKKPVPIFDMIRDSNYGFGFPDPEGRITTNETDSNAPLIIFDNQHIGRGVQILDYANPKTVHLVLSLPSTEYDVKMLYSFAERIAKYWKTNTITIEKEAVRLTDITRYQDYDLNMNIHLLGDAVSMFPENVCLYCATIPIWCSTKQLSSYADDYNAFASFLHEKQDICAYLSTAEYFRFEGHSEAFYVIFPNEAIILPKQPSLKYNSENGDGICDNAYITIVNLFPDETVSKIEYGSFISAISLDKISEFDLMNNLIQPLSEIELRQIFRP